MNLWGVVVSELDSHLDRNKGPDHTPCPMPWSIDPSFRSLILAILHQTTNPFIARPLSENPNCAL